MLITLNKRIILEFHKQKYGHDTGEEKVNESTVWACVGLPNMNFKNTAQTAGVKVDLIVHLHRTDFEKNNWTHIEIDNTLYRITNVGTSINDLFIKLAIARDT